MFSKQFNREAYLELQLNCLFTYDRHRCKYQVSSTTCQQDHKVNDRRVKNKKVHLRPTQCWDVQTLHTSFPGSKLGIYHCFPPRFNNHHPSTNCLWKSTALISVKSISTTSPSSNSLQIHEVFFMKQPQMPPLLLLEGVLSTSFTRKWSLKTFM